MIGFSTERDDFLDDLRSSSLYIYIMKEDNGREGTYPSFLRIVTSKSVLVWRR